MSLLQGGMGRGGDGRGDGDRRMFSYWHGVSTAIAIHI